MLNLTFSACKACQGTAVRNKSKLPNDVEERASQASFAEMLQGGIMMQWMVSAKVTVPF